MSLKNRLGIVFLILCMLSIEVYIGWLNLTRMEHYLATHQFESSRQTLILWYTDDALTDYLNMAALAYYEDTDVYVELELVSGLEYLENINRVSIRNGDTPDLFIVGNDSLGKAYLAGLASEVRDAEGILTTDNFCQAALDAVTYQGKYVAYPMYFETSYLLYNKTYLYEIAMAEMEAEWPETEQDNTEQGDAEDTQDDQESDESTEDGTPLTEDPMFLEAVAIHAQELVPTTVDGILDFADRYDAPENVDAIFEWDVSTIFYNYFFVGNYVNVGGESGDSPREIDIYNENAIRCLAMYQELNQFFSIDADAVTYDSVIQDFLDGKTIFTLATSDAVGTLEQAQIEGSFPYEYGVALIPDLTETLAAREVSYTDAVAVNGYSSKKTEANDFARYLCTECADELYARSGKVAANQNIRYDNDALNVIMEAYAETIPMPKLVETSNFWLELEMSFTNVWLGDDANLTLKRLSEAIHKQITGGEYEEIYIEIPIEDETEADEDSEDSEDDVDGVEE